MAVPQRSKLVGMGQQGPGGTGDGVARLVLTTADDKLDVRMYLRSAGRGALQHGDHRNAGR